MTDTYERNLRGRYMECLSEIVDYIGPIKVLEGEEFDAIAWAIDRIEYLENYTAKLAAEVDELLDDAAVNLLGEDR